MNVERKLATIRRISEVKDIPGASLIQAYRVDGWWVVDRKNAYGVDDLVIYCEIDSWIPHEIAPFLSKGKEPREYNGVRGERLRTIKLKGQLSQGLLLPTTIIEGPTIYENEDVTEKLGIIKWEYSSKSNAQLSGQIKGSFPHFIIKTDQERIQNLVDKLPSWKAKGGMWEVTEKLDGSSCTFFVKDGEVGVCSRNLELKEDENNAYWKVAMQGDIPIINKIKKLYSNLAFQGELVGEGIQGNPYKIKGLEFYLFDIWDIDNQWYLTPEHRKAIATSLDIKHVPILTNIMLSTYNYEFLLESANGTSMLHDTKREGLVLKCYEDTDLSFKIISNEWLLKEK